METSRKIALQSSLKTINDWASNNGHQLTLSELISISDFLADYVEHGYNDVIKEGCMKIDEYLAKKKTTKF